MSTPKGVLCSDHESETNNRELEKFGLHCYTYWRRLSKEVMARGSIFEVSGPPPKPKLRFANSPVVISKDAVEGDVEYWAYFDDDEWVKLDAW